MGIGTPRKGSMACLDCAPSVSSCLQLREAGGPGCFGIASSIGSRYPLQTLMDWNDDALAALKKDVPFFVRPAVRRRVESMAVDDNRHCIDLSFYLQAKASMAPK